MEDIFCFAANKMSDHLKDHPSILTSFSSLTANYVYLLYYTIFLVIIFKCMV